ncbi:MAG: hypothetical protein AB7F99_15765 [Vicinamibacterales bacterium]
MQNLEGFPFQSLRFDRNGRAQAGAGIDALIAHARSSDATDAILLAHGFRNSEAEALTLYSKLLESFRLHLRRPEIKSALHERRFVVGGILWPSKAFREADDFERGGTQGLDDVAAEREDIRARLLALRNDASPDARSQIDRAAALLPSLENNPGAQNEFVDLVLSVLVESEDDPTEGLQQVRAQTGSELLDKLAIPIVVPTAGPDGEGGVAAVGEAPPMSGEALGVEEVFMTIAGRVGLLLNLTTWYLMKERSAVVGAAGVADAVRRLKADRPDIKVHLVGHSLGARLMASTAKALCAAPAVKADSLILLEGAFSHYGFASNNGRGTPGFFRDVVARHIIKGPIVATHSLEDTVVGKAYALASRLAGDNTKAVGDASDPFGGIGRNGAQLTTESSAGILREPGTPYAFTSGAVNNLDGSGGLISDHGDVTNPAVTYALACAVART